MTEREYRKLRKVSYSSLKTFADSRWDYYNLYEDGTGGEESTESMTIGNVVDCILLEPEDFHNRFVVATCGKPTGQMGDFVDQLFKLTKECMDVDGLVTRNIQSLMRDAYDKVAFDSRGERVAFKRKTFEQVVTDFASGTGEEFYRQQRETVDKTLISPGDEERAQKVIEKLIESSFTRDLINLHTEGKYEVLNQPKIVWSTQYSYDCKAMIDKVIINHDLKIIQPFDLKTTYDPDNFNYNYLKYRYYIQALMYHYALMAYKHQRGLEEYEIKPMKFIVADSNAKSDPLIYVCTNDNLHQAMVGFRVGERSYRGVDYLMDDLMWHKEENVWSRSRENDRARGICAIKIYE